MAERTTNQSLVIGIDFGTTFSGIAWAIMDDQKSVQVISSWPGSGNRSSVKTPTVMAFLEDRFLWGWQALALSPEPIRGVKLLLDESQSYRYSPSLNANKLLGAMKKSPVDIASEYLKALAHTNEMLERRLGSAYNDMDRKFVLTVPAVWSDKAKDNTLKAAINAGIPEHRLALLSEPEAAALYTLRAIQPNTIKKNDTFIVCDAGGGTVDLNSYRVHDLSPLSLEEVVEGTGGFTGTDCEDDFDYVGWRLPLPGTEDNGEIELEGGYLQLSKSQIQGVFDPVVQDVLSLVHTQVRRIRVAGLPLQAILLVGGFGSCEYLYRRLRRAYPRITVIQPQDAWQAIACGAVLRGIEGNQVRNRLARSHYGVKYCVTYNAELHNRNEAHWCRFREKLLVSNIMRWFISKGTPISENEPVRKRFCRKLVCDVEASLIFREGLYFSSSEMTPYKLSNDVNHLCDLRVDLRAVPKELFKRRTNSTGLSYYSIDFDLAIIPTSGYMYFQVEFNGTTYGKVQAEYY
ncbi:Heat shock protein 70 family [Penicillium occitanis (nom. inval.)]|nr:Heat shock protein 70 family [Penicillium occitanis (nom. inval.)]